jgi:hypothetical protein
MITALPFLSASFSLLMRVLQIRASGPYLCKVALGNVWGLRNGINKDN